MFIVDVAAAQTISRAFVGEDGKVQVIFANGAVKIMVAETQQVGCDNVAVAEDKRSVGWSVLVENCCTSYPIATSVVVYRDGKKKIIAPGQMIWKWRFVPKERVAVLSGPVHGWASAANLYSIRTGKIHSSWGGTGKAPKWAEDWRDQFESSQAENQAR
jgi:hypothetical protein